ncbi:MAG: hypothetical protein KF862_14485 [Chitinophagaceae bacterium]|nr:hypothetical protein [Chitinophagaceae bacterium]
MSSNVQCIENRLVALGIDMNGGAFTRFSYHGSKINPLSFRFSKKQMPAVNRKGASFKGHFVCAGRWGAPSEGERKAGVPYHGEAANDVWRLDEKKSRKLVMSTEGKREFLKIKRVVRLHPDQPVWHCHEEITNTASLGRLFNLVQHPTIAAPFLDADTRVFCNADKGFHFEHYEEPVLWGTTWPRGLNTRKKRVRLDKSDTGDTGVYSFVVAENDPLGWIIAYAPEHNLLLGYIWARRDYPWINVWQQYDGKSIKYRGLEFGTTGIHQPFDKIIARCDLSVLNEQVLGYLDAGTTITKAYISFLIHPPARIKKVTGMLIDRNHISLLQGKDIIGNIPAAALIKKI